MDDYLKQHLFNEENVKLFYLSPYIEIRITDDHIALIAQESDMAMLLPVTEKKAFRLVEMLRAGIEEEALKSMLADILDGESEDWLYSCIWEGIIE